MTTMTRQSATVTIGIDTHADVHLAAALDQQGRVLATTEAAATRAGHTHLVRWIGQLTRRHPCLDATTRRTSTGVSYSPRHACLDDWVADGT